MYFYIRSERNCNHHHHIEPDLNWIEWRKHKDNNKYTSENIVKEFKIKPKSGQFKPSVCVQSELHKCSLQQLHRQLMAHDYAGKHKRKQQGGWMLLRNKGMNMHLWKSLPSSVWKEHQRSELISGGSTVSSDVHPHCASIPPHPSTHPSTHPSLMMRWMMVNVRVGQREGGTDYTFWIHDECGHRA